MTGAEAATWGVGLSQGPWWLLWGPGCVLHVLVVVEGDTH